LSLASAAKVSAIWRGQQTPPEDAYVEALDGHLEIIADFGDQRLAFAEPGTEAA
jgi:hypothetical protein